MAAEIAGLAGIPSPQVITVQGVVGGVPIAVAGGGGGGTVDQGLPAVVGNAWPIKVTDGVDTAAVIPGATAPVAGDPALCVTISPNSGAIMASDASVGVTGAAVPGSTQQNGGTDGAALRANRMFDLNSGAGVEFNLGVNLRASAPGGSVEAGTVANPLQIAAASLPLPTGAATAALQTQPGVDIGDVTVNNGAGAAAVNIQDGGNSITVDGTVAVSGSVAVTGPLTDAELRASAVPISTTQLPAALAGGRLDTNTGAWLGSTAPTVGQKTSASSVPVVLASDQPSIPVAVTPNVVGTEGNAWSAAAVLAAGVSASIDCQYTPNISVFGNVAGGATTLTVQFSQDNVNFYDATNTVANGDFSLSGVFGARYLRLKSSNARTITATIAGKG
jgi:hypothetical protein